jgi:hypothetical protein
MAKYIKANSLVARYLSLENSRTKLSDNNYILWQNDMMRFGSLTKLNEILTRIGGIALAPHEAKEEQDGIVLRPLPYATDPRFQQPTTSSSSSSASNDEDETTSATSSEADETADSESEKTAHSENEETTESND